MDNQVTTKDLINYGFLAFNIFWAIWNSKNTRSFESKQKYVPDLIDTIFKPFYESIECNLFIKITKRNKKMILSNLNLLYSTLKEEKLLFYISDRLLVQLDTLIHSDHLTIKKLNRQYQLFSSTYLTELNRVRKIAGLNKRTVDFRVHFKLYKRNITWLFMKYFPYALLISYGIYMILYTILGIIHTIKSL